MSLLSDAAERASRHSARSVSCTHANFVDIFVKQLEGLSHCLPSLTEWCSQTRTTSYSVVVEIFLAFTGGCKQRDKAVPGRLTGGVFWLIEPWERLLTNHTLATVSKGVGLPQGQLMVVISFASGIYHKSKANHIRDCFGVFEVLNYYKGFLIFQSPAIRFNTINAE